MRVRMHDDVFNDICFTISKLAKIGYFNDDSRSFCENVVETVTHLFIDCINVELSFFVKIMKNV